MSKLTEKNEIDEIADGDLFYVRDASAPSDPDKKVPFSKVRPAGSRITHHHRFAGNITVPSMAAGVEADGTLTVNGAVVGDHVSFNMEPPANIAILACWVSASDTVKVRFRNNHASTAYVSAAVACVALVSRSID
jgi:hypothetical protein